MIKVVMNFITKEAIAIQPTPQDLSLECPPKKGDKIKWEGDFYLVQDVWFEHEKNGFCAIHIAVSEETKFKPFS